MRPTGALAEKVNPHCLAFSPDGRRLAVGLSRSLAVVVVFIYDVQSRRQLEVLQFQSSLTAMMASRKPDGVASIVFSPDGRWLLVGSRSGAIHAWDTAESPAKHYAWQAHKSEIESLVASRDGQRAISAAHEAEVKAWQIPSTGRALASWKTNEPFNLSLSPDGQTIACGTSSLTMLKSDNLEPAEGWTIPLRSIRRVCFSPDGLWIAADYDNGRELRLVNARTGEIVKTIVDPELGIAHDGTIDNIDFSHDGSLIVTGGGDRVKIWDVASGTLVSAFSQSGLLYPMFQPNGRLLATTGNMQVTLFEMAGMREQTVMAQQLHPLRSVEVAAESEEVVCASEQLNAPRGFVTRWDLTTGRLVSEWPVLEQVTSAARLALDPKGEFLALSGPGLGVALWRAHGSSPSPCARQNVPAPFGLSFSRDGRKLWGGIPGSSGVLGAPAAGRVVSWSLPDLKLATEWANTLSSLKDGVSGISCVSGGQRWIVAGSLDATIKLVDAQTGGVVDSFASSAGRIQCVAIHPNDDLILAGTEKGAVVVVRILKKKIIVIDDAHTDSVTSLAFSGDGKLLATASRDRTIRLWQVDASELLPLLTLRPASGPVATVRINHDGSKLVYLTLNETAVRVWHLDLLRQRLVEVGLGWE